jgi:hypothetical protein
LVIGLSLLFAINVKNFGGMQKVRKKGEHYTYYSRLFDYFNLAIM